MNNCWSRSVLAHAYLQRRLLSSHEYLINVIFSFVESRRSPSPYFDFPFTSTLPSSASLFFTCVILSFFFWYVCVGVLVLLKCFSIILHIFNPFLDAFFISLSYLTHTYTHLFFLNSFSMLFIFFILTYLSRFQHLCSVLFSFRHSPTSFLPTSFFFSFIFFNVSSYLMHSSLHIKHAGAHSNDTTSLSQIHPQTQTHKHTRAPTYFSLCDNHPNAYTYKYTGTNMDTCLPQWITHTDM